MKKFMSRALAGTCASTLCFPILLRAAEEHHEVAFHTLLPFFPNFVIFLLFCVWFFAPKFSSFWRTRSEVLQQEYDRGTRALEEAEARLRTARELFSTIDEQIALTKKEIEAESVREAEQLHQNALVKAEQMRERTKQAIEGERRALETSVRAEVARRALDRAQIMLKSQLDASTDASLRKRTYNNAQGGLLAPRDRSSSFSQRGN